MGPPYMWIGIWEPNSNDWELKKRCGASLRAAGARVIVEEGPEGGGSVTFSRYEALCAPGDTLLIESGRVEEPGPGGLVAIVVSTDYFDDHPRLSPGEAWGRLREALGRLCSDVQPLILVCAVEYGVAELADPPEDAAWNLFQTGWINEQRLAPVRRNELRKALGTLRFDLGGGWWWSSQADLDPAGRGTEDSDDLTRAIHEAWTGHPPSPRAVTMSELELPHSLTEIWLWSAERDERRLVAETVAWIDAASPPVEGVELGPNGERGFFPVTIELAQDDPRGIELLRRIARDLVPSWVAFMPESGIAVPGLTPDIPSTGVLFNFWVADDWIGTDALAQLDAILAGAHRETLADGTLFVTQPSTLPDGHFADWCRDPAARWDRLVDAAAVLAIRARETVAVAGGS